MRLERRGLGVPGCPSPSMSEEYSTPTRRWDWCSAVFREWDVVWWEVAPVNIGVLCVGGWWVGGLDEVDSIGLEVGRGGRIACVLEVWRGVEVEAGGTTVRGRRGVGGRGGGR